MNVTYATASLVGKCGGIPSVAYHEVLALDKMGWLKNLVCHKYFGEDLNAKDRDDLNIYEGEIDKIRMDRVLFDISPDSDVLHTWATVACESAHLMKHLGKKMIFTFCDPIWDKPLLEERVKWNVQLYREGEWETWRRFYWAIKYGDYIVANSNFTKNGITDLGFPEENVLVNYHGTEFVENPPPLPDEFKVLFLGSACLRKGTGYLLAALAHMPDVKLLIQGTWGEEIESWLKILTPNMEYRPASPHIEDAYKECSVYIQPSIVDGCPIPVLEAMMRCRPVIATTNCGSGELVKDGWSGFIIPPRDVKAIKMAIQYFIDNPSEIKRMGDNARKTAEDHSWDVNEKILQRWYCGL